MKHDKIEDIICPVNTSFLQFVSDNTDHDMATLDGKNTHHGLGSIAIANGDFSTETFERQRIPREKREAWNNIIKFDAPNIIIPNKNYIENATKGTVFI